MNLIIFVCKSKSGSNVKSVSACPAQLILNRGSVSAAGAFYVLIKLGDKKMCLLWSSNEISNVWLVEMLECKGKTGPSDVRQWIWFI